MPREALTVTLGYDEQAYCEGEAVTPSVQIHGGETGLCCDPERRTITMENAGVYLIHWVLQLTVCSPDAASDIVIALESADGQTRYALSGTRVTAHQPCGCAVGSAVVEAQAGEALVLRNRSRRGVRFVCAEGPDTAVSANLSVVRLA